MTTNGAALLSDPQPRAHIVYPYTEESHLIDAVSLFASCGLRKDEAVLLFATEDHRRPILNRLHAEGFDLNALQSSGQLACENAHQLISTFLFDGIVDELVFKTKILTAIGKAKGADGKRPVRVFGEMVNLTWQAHATATERL